MMILSRQSLLAIAAVVDVALHARPAPVAAKALAVRNNLPPRHLETLLQSLVRANILKGVRGPRGGYELARERRRISAGDIVRAALDEGGGSEAAEDSALVTQVVAPMVQDAALSFLGALDGISVDELCQRAARQAVAAGTPAGTDFTI